MRKALQSFFPSINGPTGGARQEFYNVFQREANERDRDFTEKYDSDLDTTLIFVSVSPPIHLDCDVYEFSRGIVRPILRRHVHPHRRHSDQSPTGLHTIELRPPPGYSQQHQRLAWRACHNWFCRHSPSMDWS